MNKKLLKKLTPNTLTKYELCEHYATLISLIAKICRGSILQKQLIDYMILLKIAESDYKARVILTKLEVNNIILRTKFLNTKNLIVSLRKFAYKFLSGDPTRNNVTVLKKNNTNKRIFKSILLNHYLINWLNKTSTFRKKKFLFSDNLLYILEELNSTIPKNSVDRIYKTLIDYASAITGPRWYPIEIFSKAREKKYFVENQFNSNYNKPSENSIVNNLNCVLLQDAELINIYLLSLFLNPKTDALDITFVILDVHQNLTLTSLKAKIVFIDSLISRFLSYFFFTMNNRSFIPKKMNILIDVVYYEYTQLNTEKLLEDLQFRLTNKNNITLKAHSVNMSKNYSSMNSINY